MQCFTPVSTGPILISLILLATGLTPIVMAQTPPPAFEIPDALAPSPKPPAKDPLEEAALALKDKAMLGDSKALMELKKLAVPADNPAATQCYLWALYNTDSGNYREDAKRLIWPPATPTPPRPQLPTSDQVHGDRRCRIWPISR